MANNEILLHSEEFEQKLPIETERKFLPLYPERLARFRQESKPVEQLYLSHPDEPFSLRLRESFDEHGALAYTATLKDDGQLTPEGLQRIEVEASISATRYSAYRAQSEYPLLRKLRAEPQPGIAIDFYDDGKVQVESEHPITWQMFNQVHGNRFVDVSNDVQAQNEWIAHFAYRHAHEGAEALELLPELQPNLIASDICRQLALHPHVTVHIGGRSGSGKSTLVREVRQHLEEYGIGSVVISSDDYHRGTRWLNHHNNGELWTDWDAPIVYDTKTMASDIEQLKAGQPIPKRAIDWSVAEPIINGEISPAPVILIEGIYALSPELTRPDSLTYEMTTPLATCIGRRLLRDLRERPEFADASKSLAYMLEYAEPAYQDQLRART